MVSSKELSSSVTWWASMKMTPGEISEAEERGGTKVLAMKTDLADHIASVECDGSNFLEVSFRLRH